MFNLHCARSSLIDKGTLVSLFLLVLISTTFFVPQSYAQTTGVSVGLVFTDPHLGGLSVRYRGFQFIFSGAGKSTDGSYFDASIRYNHPLQNWERVRFGVFGQVGQAKTWKALELTDRYRYHFTGGFSWEFRISKRFSMTSDIGLSIDHTGYVERYPAIGTGIHFFF